MEATSKLTKRPLKAQNPAAKRPATGSSVLARIDPNIPQRNTANRPQCSQPITSNTNQPAERSLPLEILSSSLELLSSSTESVGEELPSRENYTTQAVPASSVCDVDQNH